MQDKLNKLNGQISEAIYVAERIKDQRSSEALAAYAKVSLLEEEITSLVPASSVEGAIARRGAVRAAVNADNLARAKTLVARFVAENVGTKLSDELRALLPS